MNLVVVDESGLEKRLPLDADRVTIGRASDNVVRLPDKFASRHHAELLRTDGRWTILDVGSKSGIHVNRRKIDGSSPLLPGDAIRIGRTSLRLDDSTDEEISVSISEGGDIDVTREIRTRRAAPSDLARVVADAVRAMISGQPTVKTLRDVLEIALDVTDADRALIALIDDRGEIGERTAVTRRGGDSIELSRGILQRAVRGRESVILREVGGGMRPSTLRRHDVRSVLCTPLVDDDAVRGVFYLDSVGHSARFEDAHLEIISTLASLCGIALQHSESRRVAARARELTVQLDAAAEIQRKLLPPRDPQPPPGFLAGAWQSMCHAVGGDFYDFFETVNGYGALLADVAGKRLDAALIMANLHAEWMGVRNSGRHPEDWLRLINEHMCACLPDNRFITLALAIADAREDRLLFANAGHNACFHLRGESITPLKSGGLAIGIMRSHAFRLDSLEFRPGDRLVMYSDGLIDQLGPGGEPFGEERLVDVLAANSGAKPCELRTILLDALDRHSRDAPQDDDITIAILGRDGTP